MYCETIIKCVLLLLLLEKEKEWFQLIGNTICPLCSRLQEGSIPNRLVTILYNGKISLTRFYQVFEKIILFVVKLNTHKVNKQTLYLLIR